MNKTQINNKYRFFKNNNISIDDAVEDFYETDN